MKQEVIVYLSPSQADKDEDEEEVASTPPSSEEESGSDWSHACVLVSWDRELAQRINHQPAHHVFSERHLQFI